MVIPFSNWYHHEIIAKFITKAISDVSVYTQTTSRCRIQLELDTSLGKALIEENGYSLTEINNDG